MAITIPIKGLSVNEGYKGRRFKTDKHKSWTRSVMFLLPPKINLPKTQYYRLYLKFGMSSKCSDGDNLIKFFQDSIATKYKFNDKKIRSWLVDTEIVAKGKEFITFEILEYV